jgi:hypothetical protein
MHTQNVPLVAQRKQAIEAGEPGLFVKHCMQSESLQLRESKSLGVPLLACLVSQ